MISKIPHHLLQDNDGHWYMVPEINVSCFEQTMQLMVQAEPYVAHLAHEEFNGSFGRFRIDGPHRLRIYHWEEA